MPKITLKRAVSLSIYQERNFITLRYNLKSFVYHHNGQYTMDCYFPGKVGTFGSAGCVPRLGSP